MFSGFNSTLCYLILDWGFCGSAGPWTDFVAGVRGRGSDFGNPTWNVLVDVNPDILDKPTVHPYPVSLDS